MLFIHSEKNIWLIQKVLVYLWIPLNFGYNILIELFSIVCWVCYDFMLFYQIVSLANFSHRACSLWCKRITIYVWYCLMHEYARGFCVCIVVAVRANWTVTDRRHFDRFSTWTVFVVIEMWRHFYFYRYFSLNLMHLLFDFWMYNFLMVQNIIFDTNWKRFWYVKHRNDAYRWLHLSVNTQPCIAAFVAARNSILPPPYWYCYDVSFEFEKSNRKPTKNSPERNASIKLCLFPLCFLYSIKIYSTKWIWFITHKQHEISVSMKWLLQYLLHFFL